MLRTKRERLENLFKSIKPCNEETAKDFFGQLQLNEDETAMVSQYSNDIYNNLFSFIRHNDDKGYREIFEKMLGEGSVPDSLAEDTRRYIQNLSYYGQTVELDSAIDDEFQKRVKERRISKARNIMGDSWPLFETLRSLSDVSGLVANQIDVPESLIAQVEGRDGEVFRKILERINENNHGAQSRIDLLEYDEQSDLVEQLQKRFPGKHLVIFLDSYASDASEFDPCNFWNARILDFAEKDNTEFVFAATTEMSDASWTQRANALGHHHIRLPQKDLIGFTKKYNDDEDRHYCTQYVALVNGKSNHIRGYYYWDNYKIYNALKIITQ